MNFCRAILISVSFFLLACEKQVEKETNNGSAELASLLEEGEHLPGGKLNTVQDISPNAFSFPSPALKKMEKLNFFVGNSFFKTNWVASPASTKARDGLGPTFNSRSCAGCHLKDGRGSPEFAGKMTTGLLLRLSIPGKDKNGGPLPEPVYGGQLNDHGIPNVPHEGSIKVEYEEIKGEYPDGTQYSLRKPTYSIEDLQYGPLHKDVMISPRVGQHIIGMGLLEAIPEKDIIANADPEDKNNDGISGRANYVWDAVEGKKSLGRFGWKANQPSVKQQTAGAFLGDIGITTSLNPGQNYTQAQKEAQLAPEGGKPEMDDDDLDKTVLYVANLAVPYRRNHKEPEILQGKKLFNQAQCQACHVPKFTTGDHPDFSNLSNQTIFPYTDLLLHDMGPELADNRPDFEADGNEWRTPPLWGLGLIKTVNNHTFLLHDGRARSIEEAILWHGGEAEKSRDLFKNLSAKERELLIKFVESL